MCQTLFSTNWQKLRVISSWTNCFQSAKVNWNDWKYNSEEKQFIFHLCKSRMKKQRSVECTSDRKITFLFFNLLGVFSHKYLSCISCQLNVAHFSYIAKIVQTLSQLPVKTTDEKWNTRWKCGMTDIVSWSQSCFCSSSEPDARWEC